MDKKDFFDLEDQIRDTVKSALNAIDFATLKKDIGSKADDTLNDVKSKLKYKSDEVNVKIKDKSKEFSEKIEDSIQNKYRNTSPITKKDKNKAPMYISKRPVGRISGILYTIFGFGGSGLFGVLLIIYLIFNSSPSESLSMKVVRGVFVLGAFFVASIALFLRGRYLRRRVKRFKKYVSSLDGQNYCSIEKLATSIERKNKYVVKDLRKMSKLGMFKEVHIDDKQTHFMLSNEVYDDYIKSQESLKQRNEEELKRQEKLNEEINDPKKRELRDTIEMGKNYINQIKSVNDAIPEEEISKKLYRLENIVTQILDYIENNPKKLAEVNKFTNHYLPITLKLVNSYKELNDQMVQGENIKSAKNEIEKSIDIINIAFEKLLDDLFEEIALDISTDISVLETLFTQEGLTNNDFKK
ncbi:hypothetical protein psyc5s11_11370 [Clostridium gelidum]|uniref:5-bromo-4-chloroindolyl phosphate hydrolysis protein n=1 Tax=Clostridium gelidum TaxID=704125 RepID=A0ABM7T1M4_9CLOT|nr:5-bromo-4-chloroindolyl phosphate hydrolysis family protein [Clostridium gelidum]BCZ45070.1 hypothetical protein psyc5s11_11370 [Clostridium gelidum]